MRYELSDYEWAAIKPMLPNKPRGVPRVNDRRVLNGIFWVLRSGAPWRDLPETYGPRTTCYNRFVRWRRAGVWDQIIDALAAGHDAAVQMIDTSVVRVHQHGACVADNNHQDMGRSRGGLTSKIHAVVDTNGLPVHLALTPAEAHDNRLCSVLLSALLPQTMLLADRGYDAGGFTKTIEIPPIASIPFDSRMFGTAANNGQMIAEIASSHRTTKTFLQIAQRLTGRGEAKNPRGSFLSPIIRKLRVNKA